MPLMLLFQVHKELLPIFLVWFILSEPIYYSIYLEIFVGTRTCKCCVALLVLNVRLLCVRLFVSLCFSCAFYPLLLICQHVEGRHHLLYYGFLSFGRQVSAENLPPWPFLRLVCLVERVEIRYTTNDRLPWEINLLPSHSSTLSCHQCVVSMWGLCVDQMFAWAKIPIPLFTFNLTLMALPLPLTPSSPHPSSQPLRVNVAVLSTTSRGQDLTSSCLTSSCSRPIW